jgi:hypothetical protein
MKTATGLCPRVKQSKATDARGPISKHGPKYLRWALFEAALNACKHPHYAERDQHTKRRNGRPRVSISYGTRRRPAGARALARLSGPLGTAPAHEGTVAPGARLPGQAVVLSDVVAPRGAYVARHAHGDLRPLRRPT